MQVARWGIKEGKVREIPSPMEQIDGLESEQGFQTVAGIRITRRSS